MKELLSYILNALCEKPEKIEIEESSEDENITFNITIDDEDKGRIIGKGGLNIKAIREILAIIAKRENKRVFLKII